MATGLRMRVALVSTGLGRVLRGFESFTRSLHEALLTHVPELDVTLFQGGPSERKDVVVVPNFHRSDVPARWFPPLRAYQIECRSFALALYPMLVRHGFDVVHYNELPMGSALYHLRRHLGGRFRLLYCNGAPSPPVHYRHRCDAAQLLTGPDQELALEQGFPSERIIALPYGIDETRFHPKKRGARDRVRAELGIPSSARVVLSLAAIKTEHKRIDHLIKETAQLGGNVWLLVAGQRTEETPALERLAEASIPGRWCFASWPHERVPELCGAADVFALCSLTEAFGLVTIEAMLSGLPVIVHDGPVFRWLVENTDSDLVDMARQGALANALRRTFSALASREGLAQRTSTARSIAASRFGWAALSPAYLDMYARVVRGRG